MSHDTGGTITAPSWGRWSLDPALAVLRHPHTGYEVDLERCLTPAAALDWIAQVAGKTWPGHDATVAGLVHAMDAVLNVQATLCPCGTPLRLTRAEVRRRCHAYATGAT